MDVKPNQHQAPHAWPAPPNGTRTDPEKAATASQDGASVREDAAGDEAPAAPSGAVATEPATDEPSDRPSPDELLPPTLSPQTQTALQAHREGAVRLSRALAMDNLPGIEAILKASPGLVNTRLVGESTALHIAVREGKEKTVALLLAQDLIDPNPVDADGYTPLHEAVTAGNLAIVRQLIAHQKTDVNAELPAGSTPFLIAIETGRLDIAGPLLEARADVQRVTEGGNTPLHIACQGGDVDAVTWLIERLSPPVRADASDLIALLNSRNDEGNSALRLAMEEEHLDVVEVLAGQVDIDLNLVDHDGWPPLHAAIDVGYTQMALLLLGHPGIQVALKLSGGATPLHVAAKRNDVDVIQRLVALQADINAANDAGETPLHLAVSAGQRRAVGTLLSRTDVDPNAFDHRGLTPLHRAVQVGNKGLAMLLLAHDRIDVNASSPPSHITPFYAAIQGRHLDLAQLLLSRGADLNAPNHEGHTPLHIACAHGDLPAVQWLTDPATRTRHAPLSLNTTARDGTTALQLAVRGGRETVVAHLMKILAIDPNTCDATGWGPLHEAIKTERVDIVKLLLGVDKTDAALRGPDGIPPLELVAMAEHPMPLIEAFRSAMARRDMKAAAAQPTPSLGLRALIDMPSAPRQIDSFKALTDIQNRWGARAVSMAAQRGKSNEVILALHPPEMARPTRLEPTTYKRGWLVTGHGQDTWERRHLADLGTQGGIEMHSCGDGKRDLTWEELKRLPIQPGDFVICHAHAIWNESLQRVMLEVGHGEFVPLVDAARVFFEKGALKMLMLGCGVSLAADPLIRRFRSDPSIPRPADGDGGYQGLDITVVGREGTTLISLNLDVSELFLKDCIRSNVNTRVDTGVRTQSVQPQLTVGWDTTRAAITVTRRAGLQANGLDPNLSDEQAKVIKEGLLLMHVMDNKLADIRDLLTQHGVAATAQLDTGTSAFFLACQHGRLAIAELLMEHGADIHQADEEGDFPLHNAAASGSTTLVEMLLSHRVKGLPVTFPDLDIEAALQAANEKGHHKIGQMLQDHQRQHAAGAPSV